MIRIVEDLLFLARIESRAIALEKEKIELTGLLKNILENMSILSEAKKIVITAELQGEFHLTGDRHRLKRVFQNIVDNAVKYTPPGGTIAVTAVREKDCCVVSITDNGEGIPEQELPYIFERFFRVDKSRTQTGFGLGLSIAKSIVESHGGRITVASTLKKGSSFCIYLPLSA